MSANDNDKEPSGFSGDIGCGVTFLLMCIGIAVILVAMKFAGVSISHG